MKERSTDKNAAKNGKKTYYGSSSHPDTLLPLQHLRGNYPKTPDGQPAGKARSDAPREKAGQSAATRTGEAQSAPPPAFIPLITLTQPSGNRRETPQQAALHFKTTASEIPPRILEMMKLYKYGNGSFEEKCRNFIRQGRFMEDYEDDAPWNGEYKRYFATYHDLNLNQLRGYFAWRAHVRKGDFRRITTSLAYMYIYELLCGIGAASPEETLRKMKEFEEGYLDSGIGDPSMRGNLHRWRMEFAVLNGSSLEDVKENLDPEMLARDRNLQILRYPEEMSDEEVFSALDALTDGKTEKSSVIRKEPARGKHLFAEVWRYMSKHYMADGWDVFDACFGKQRSYPWHPLANAIYLDRKDREDTVYEVNPCRKFICRDGAWSEYRYDSLFFDRYRIHGIMHEADRQLRRYLKTGSYLRPKKGEEWAAPYIEAVIEADKEAALEAERPKITIDLTGLDKIRRDAAITRDSLLTEEEKREMLPGEMLPMQEDMQTAGEEAEHPAEKKAVEIMSLDAAHTQILLAVMRGEPYAEVVRAGRLIPSVVTDAINEALFDEIGDNAFECEGDEITLIEEYREELEQILGGDT